MQQCLLRGHTVGWSVPARQAHELLYLARNAGDLRSQSLNDLIPAGQVAAGASLQLPERAFQQGHPALRCPAFPRSEAPQPSARWPRSTSNTQHSLQQRPTLPSRP